MSSYDVIYSYGTIVQVKSKTMRDFRHEGVYKVVKMSTSTNGFNSNVTRTYYFIDLMKIVNESNEDSWVRFTVQDSLAYLYFKVLY